MATTKSYSSLSPNYRRQRRKSSRGERAIVPRIVEIDDQGKYRSFIENLPVLFYAVKPYLPFSPIYVSPAFAKFGYSLDQWLHDPDIWAKIIHPDDLERVFHATAASTDSGQDVEYEYRTVTAAGE